MERVEAIILEGPGSEILKYISQEKNVSQQVPVMEFMESLYLEK